MKAHVLDAKDGARNIDITMVVEPGPRGHWWASRVQVDRSLVLSRLLVEAAPLRDPGIRCMQKLGARLLAEAGDARSILFAIDRLAPRDPLNPSLITTFPVSIFAASPSIVSACAAPRSANRFAFLDFGGRGSLSLVKRSTDGRICDYAKSAGDLYAYLGMDRAIESESGDMLVDGMDRSSHGGQELFATALLHAIGPLLESAYSFGFETFVCASRLFSDAAASSIFLRAMTMERGRSGRFELVSGEDHRAIASARFLSTASVGPGTWISGPTTERTLSVSAPRKVEYHVTHVDHPVFDLDEPALARLLDSRPAMFVIDKVVKRKYGVALARYAQSHLNCVDICPIDATEATKTWPVVEEICSRAIRAGLRRDGVIVAVGGGITLDVTGLAAALYRRGVRYARVPTTLVGMVDVCVGIKQGINLGSKKNILGAFYPPFGGINDLTFLKSVPQRQLACGIAEIVKMAIVRDPFLFELLEAHTGKLLASHFQTPHRAAEQIVIRAELAMMNELQPNLYESDLQRFVDFGHSFSPALESASHFAINHGEAVAIDMMICTALAVRRGICEGSVMRRLGGLYVRSGLALTHDLCEAEFLTESLKDIRVHRGGNLNLVVPTGIGGATFVQDVTAPEVALALHDIESLAVDVAVPEEAPRAFASG